MDAFWSVAAMPIGVMLCFSPILIAWVLAEMKGGGPENKERR